MMETNGMIIILMKDIMNNILMQYGHKAIAGNGDKLTVTAHGDHVEAGGHNRLYRYVGF